MKFTDRGQSLVEFAISLIVILILLSGVVDVGIALFQHIQIRDAAQEGALYGSICPKDFNKIEQRARAASSSPLNLQNKDVFVGVEYTDEGSAIKVTMKYDHRIFMPLLPDILGVKYIYLKTSVTDTILTEKYCD